MSYEIIGDQPVIRHTEIQLDDKKCYNRWSILINKIGEIEIWETEKKEVGFINRQDGKVQENEVMYQ